MVPCAATSHSVASTHMLLAGFRSVPWSDGCCGMAGDNGASINFLTAFHPITKLGVMDDYTTFHPVRTCCAAPRPRVRGPRARKKKALLRATHAMQETLLRHDHAETRMSKKRLLAGAARA